MKNQLPLVSLFFIMNLFIANLYAAESVECFQDNRQSEGPLITVLLKKTSKGHTLMETAKFFDSSLDTKIVLVSDLQCSLKGITGECHKNQKVGKGIFRYHLTLVKIDKTTSAPAKLKIELTASNADRALYNEKFEIHGTNERCLQVD
jgi:hypothetical protein